ISFWKGRFSRDDRLGKRVLPLSGRSAGTVSGFVPALEALPGKGLGAFAARGRIRRAGAVPGAVQRTAIDDGVSCFSDRRGSVRTAGAELSFVHEGAAVPAGVGCAYALCGGHSANRP